jgi:hypothetical protein
MVNSFPSSFREMLSPEEGPSGSGTNKNNARPSPTASTSNHRTLATIRKNSEDEDHSDADV